LNLLQLRDLYCIKMRTDENPVMNPEMVAQIEKMCIDDDERAIRLGGEFVARGGLIYPMAKERHPWFIPPFELPAGKGTLIVSIDTHISTPHGVLWIWVDWDGVIEEFPLIEDKPNLYSVSELFKNGSIPQLAEYIEQTEGVLGRKHDMAFSDPSGWNTDQTRPNEKTIAEQLSDAGVYAEKGSKDLRGGILKVRELLTIPDGADHPRLMTFTTCNRLRFERRNYRTPDLRGRAKDERAPSEKPLDKDDHIMECERRICEAVMDGKVQVIEMEVEPEHSFAEMMYGGKKIDVNFEEESEYGVIDSVIGE